MRKLTDKADKDSRVSLRRVLYSPNRGYNEEANRQGRQGLTCKLYTGLLFIDQPFVYLIDRAFKSNETYK